ncbi:ABC transporter ATP-binding protein [Diplocloster agilis]|uniref:ABC transporter ATP-binding protein n=1 Tax=Diplocloster agilis TaxID=2850323 RepID=A0A949K4Z6_9FIRM|nr:MULTISPECIES: ABC transporter ATP-binding protein [Lachnospiraceae]MBU9737061.1 ABC transporter ATP-binding protein [Diplocloster agilis]MBU9744228.1 ABC transporter ATP-binding protein [Diplocloster agilis]MCU6732500.1 ABC transporter ATP-binding protein [Suonthocola fibrivorans]SCI48982.1 Glutathione import ATP-binding protein GsiA [uncultured Clostridium sp.]
MEELKRSEQLNVKDNVNTKVKLKDQDAFLKINHLVVEYTSEGEVIHAVNDVSLSLRRGKTLGLVGETGAGKTTIAKAVMRILPERSSRIPGGEIEFNGRDILSLSEKQMQKIRGEQVSMIFQDPMTALDPVKTMGQQIAEVVRLHNDVSKKEAAVRAEEMLELVGIPASRAGEYPHQFSGGMKQRVVIAIALACRPKLLLADEPTTALDVTIQAQVLRMINDLKRKLNTSMILITHDLGVVAQNCDDVSVIYAGEIVESGTKEDIFDHPSHPYTIGLFDALPKLDSGASRLKPIVGLPPNPTDLPTGCRFHPRCPLATEACGQGKVPMKELTSGHFCRCNKRKE